MSTSSQHEERCKIENFDGVFHFLSNFHPSPMVYEGWNWRTAEHAYQAMKTTNEVKRRKIQGAYSPALAKRLGREVPMRPDWEDIKIEVMREIVKAKFDQNPLLREMLLATENAIIEEGNHWGDTFWGVCRGKGLNMLGKILMELRDEYAKSK